MAPLPSPMNLEECMPEPPSTDYASSSGGRPAEWLSVPQERIVNVEHPCLVKDFDNGLKSLGGENQIKYVGSSHFLFFVYIRI